MKELNIAINKENIRYLEYLKSNLVFPKIKIYSAICELGDSAIFSVASSDDDFVLVENKLKQLLSEIILFIFKEDYFFKNIKFDNLGAEYQQALLKALVLFDSDTDKMFIKSKLKFDKDIYLESFYNFQLKSLRKRWKEFVELTNNSDEVLNNSSFLDLLKFLIATIKPKNSLVNVYFNGECFEYKDKNNKTIKNVVGDLGDEAALITTLITLAPATVNLHCISKLSNNTCKVLYYIFDKKINLLAK